MNEDIVIQLLKEAGVDLIASLPCDKIKGLYIQVTENFRHVPLTREEEGVGICAGASLAGAKPALLIQSSGMGNAINTLCSLTKVYHLPLAILVSWRGIYEEKIPAQIPMGKYLPRVLDALEINYTMIHEKGQIPLMKPALEDAYKKNSVCAVLLSPKIWGGRGVESKSSPGERKVKALRYEGRGVHPTLTRFEIIQLVAPFLEEKAVVCNLGIPSKELFYVKHQESNFYMLGSMGMASSIGLGIAMNTKKEVVVIDGDASLLMNPGALATIAQISPENMTILSIDNGAHGSTGSQPTATMSVANLDMIARGFGLEKVYKAATKDEIHGIFEELEGESGPNFVHALAKQGNADVPNIPLTPAEIKHRFMEFLRK
ncbi:MAG: sulfopyruvate decarboxylase subunit beta [Candidatus Hydrothermarchaeales archaeon]